jgi:hypothetical protein
MTATCTNCQAHIKNIVMIDGKTYGTTCAEGILGTRLPKGFSGDYNAYAKKESVKHESQVAEFNMRKELTRKYWNDVIKVSKAMLNARRNGNSWEENFVSSIVDQSELFILYIPKKNMLDTMDETYEESNWKPAGGGTRHYFYNEPKGLDSLSERQIEILDRIA